MRAIRRWGDDVPGSRSLVFFLLLLVASSLACASGTPKTRVQNYGPGRYIVTYTSKEGVGGAREAGVRDGNVYCDYWNSVMKPVDERESIDRTGNSTVSLIFECVPGPKAEARQRRR
jgi:hypothetical protein